MTKTIAYFSAEYSVADSLPIYAGGLGILAGDTVQEAGVEGRDFYALGLVYHEAFTSGDTDERPMTERLDAEGFTLATDSNGQPLTISVPIRGESVDVRAWRKQYGTATLVLLDTRVPSNSEGAQKITDRLYDGSDGIMLKQQILLGLAGIATLEALGVTPDMYHLNEGHMAFVGLAAALRYQRLHSKLKFVEALEAIKPQLVATKHTILPGAGLTLTRETLEQFLGPTLAPAHGTVDDLMKLGGKPDGFFSTTKFMIAITCRQNGVSAIHVTSEAEAHPGSPLIDITNGVFVPRWRAASLDGAPLEFDDRNLWDMHTANRKQLLNYVESETNKTFNPHALTVVWARRMTAYKRPELLVSDIKRLAGLVNNTERPVQFIVAGQANRSDALGVVLMQQVIEAANLPELSKAFAYLPHYNPRTARLLVQGADLWLNTPVRGQEACGTSGMKASLNGALQFSTSDGWVDEIDIDSIGWALPTENAQAALYNTLEKEIAPLFYEREQRLPNAWLKKLRANIALIEEKFTAKRMLDEYYKKLYK